MLPPLLPADAAADFITVQDRQTDVEEHGIRTDALRHSDGFLSVVRLERFMPALCAARASGVVMAS